MRRVLFLSAIALIGASSSQAEFTASTLKDVDIFRTDQVSAGGIKAQLGKLLTDWVRLRYQHRKDRAKETKRLEDQITAKVRAMGSFAFVEPYYGEYATSAERSAYVTFDVVDLNSFEARMPFRRPPAGKPADPGGLIAAWQKYEQTGLDLEGRGLLSAEQRPQCPGFYCVYGSGTPDLAALEQKLAEGAEPLKAKLLEVAQGDADPKRRAAALYALSYAKDGQALSKTLMDALLDPDPVPRGAALEILSDLAVYHQEVFLDAGRIVAVLDYPTVSDRAKALSVVMAMINNPNYKPYLLTRATPYLLPLLKLSQPSNHDLAFTALSVLSGQSYDSRDYDSWEKWVVGVSSGAARPKNVR